MEKNKTHSPKGPGPDMSFAPATEESTEMTGPEMAPPPFQLFAGDLPPEEDPPADPRFSHNPGRKFPALESGEPMQMRLSPPDFALTAGPERPLEDHPPGGLPLQLQTAMEAESGMDLSDVQVHRNSERPAEMGALAYAQGTDIHLGPGQEKHLPHEAWHVVQQKQGRVQPTVQRKSAGGALINDDPGLEREADEMGAALEAKAAGMGHVSQVGPGRKKAAAATEVVQRVAVQINPAIMSEPPREEDEQKDSQRTDLPESPQLDNDRDQISNQNNPRSGKAVLMDEEEGMEISRTHETGPQGNHPVPRPMETDPRAPQAMDELPHAKQEKEKEMPVPELLTGEEGIIRDLLVVGRPEKAFGNTMGDHTSAFALHVAALKRRLKGKSYEDAVEEVSRMIAETADLPGLKMILEARAHIQNDSKGPKAEGLDQSPSQPMSDPAAALRTKLEKTYEHLKGLHTELESTKGKESGKARFALLLQDYIVGYLEYREVIPLSVINVRAKSTGLAGKGKGEHKVVKMLETVEDAPVTNEQADPKQARSAILGTFDAKGAALAAVEPELETLEEMAPGLSAGNVRERIRALALQHLITVQASFPRAFKEAFPNGMTEAQGIMEVHIVGEAQNLIREELKRLNQLVVHEIGKVEENNWELQNWASELHTKAKPMALQKVNNYFLPAMRSLETGEKYLRQLQGLGGVLTDFKFDLPRLEPDPQQLGGKINTWRQTLQEFGEKYAPKTESIQESFQNAMNNNKELLSEFVKNKSGPAIAWNPAPEESGMELSAREQGAQEGKTEKKKKKKKKEKKTPAVPNLKKRASTPNMEEYQEQEQKSAKSNLNVGQDQTSKDEDDPGDQENDLLLKEEKKQPLAVQISLDPGQRISRLELAGRTGSPFPGTMGAHTTAWVVHLDRVRNALMGQDLSGAVGQMDSLVREARQMQEDLKGSKNVPKVFAPNPESRQMQLCNGARKVLDRMNEAASGLKNEEGFMFLQSYITALLSYINYIPFSTLEAADTGGKSEGRARGCLLAYEQNREAREGIGAGELREAIYTLFDLSPTALNKAPEQEESGEAAQQLLTFLARRHLQLVKATYPEASKKARPEVDGLLKFMERKDQDFGKSKEKTGRSNKNMGFKARKTGNRLKATNSQVGLSEANFKDIDPESFDPMTELE